MLIFFSFYSVYLYSALMFDLDGGKLKVLKVRESVRKMIKF